MSFVQSFLDERLHRFLETKLKEFEERDASVEEVDEFLAEYGYYRDK